MKPEVLAAIIGASVGVIGIAFGALQAILGYAERKRLARDEKIFTALKQFEGRTQARNIGISVIEHYWDQASHLRGIFVRLLANQAIYLIEEGKPDRAHEFDNLKRIIARLETVPTSEKEYDFHLAELLNVLNARKNKPGGSRVTYTVIDDWIKRLSNRPS